MIIPIDEAWRLKSDKNCWHIQAYKKNRKDGKGNPDPWKSEYYCRDLEDACQYLVQLRLRLAEGNTLTQALGEVEKAVSALVRALSPHFRVEVRHDT